MIWIALRTFLFERPWLSAIYFSGPLPHMEIEFFAPPKSKVGAGLEVFVKVLSRVLRRPYTIPPPGIRLPRWGISLLEGFEFLGIPGIIFKAMSRILVLASRIAWSGPRDLGDREKQKHIARHIKTTISTRATVCLETLLESHKHFTQPFTQRKNKLTIRTSYSYDSYLSILRFVLAAILKRS